MCHENDKTTPEKNMSESFEKANNTITDKQSKDEWISDVGMNIQYWHCPIKIIFKQGYISPIFGNMA